MQGDGPIVIAARHHEDAGVTDSTSDDIRRTKFGVRDSRLPCSQLAERSAAKHLQFPA